MADPSSDAQAVAEQAARMERYYQLHAAIYDATRWSFLFGRRAIVQHIASMTRPQTVLEVGCGTGVNLRALHAAFPAALLTGVDVAPAMLAEARENLHDLSGSVGLIQTPYDRPLRPRRPFDLVLCSYSLTMINPGWEAAIDAAYHDLAPGGLLAVVDFHDSPVPAFTRWMGVNHVRMDGQLLPVLEAQFTPRLREVRAAYGGFWRYLLFIGEKG
jgi:S-adenosylmethionine-diacylgycerolhomoserine-N-methlytransferase